MNCNAPVSDVPSIENLGCLFGNLVSVLLALAGFTLFAVLIIGGFKFITSGGDPKAVEGARKTISGGVLGLVLILVSYLILYLIYVLTGVDIINFKIILPP